LIVRPLVCIQGLGFVGAAMAVAVASAKDADGKPAFDVAGVDLPDNVGLPRVSAINEGRFPFTSEDQSVSSAAHAAWRAGNLSATVDPAIYAKADVVVVDVHFDVALDKTSPHADFEPLRAAVRAFGQHIRPGTLVVIETTVPPGTCANIIAPELAACFRARGLSEDGFLLAHSYERVMPGEHYLSSITDYWRVYSGHTPAAAEACERFLRKFINVADYPLTRLHSPTASETAKLMENSFRAVSIAFVEEWARFAEAVGVDLFQVVDAIRKRPTHNNIRQPGFGVGGYCLTKDPLLPGVAARDIFGRHDLLFPFSEQAVQTNQKMPLVSLKALEQLLGDLVRKRILILGVAYRQDVADTRYSPSETFAVAARKRGAEILAHDPLVDYWPEMDMRVERGALPAAASVDAVVFCVPHKAYRQLDLATWLGDRARPVVLDAVGMLSDVQWAAIRAAGSRHGAIGKGPL
jgi:nucleotide sugar dehydrogenase